MILLINQYFLFGNYEMHEEVKKYIYAPKDSLYYKILANYNYNMGMLYGNQITQMTIFSYIDWGMYAFVEKGLASIEIIKALNYFGFDFKAGDVEKCCNSYYKYIEENNGEELKEWPKEGSIVETEYCIIVNL